jgi:ADP-ribosylglycohydrolase/fructose-1,6-bisphosphatase/inositol monophosphatase family enzyme
VTFDYRQALAAAEQAAAEAAGILLRECAREGGPRGAYGKCPADDEAEWAIRERLLGTFPGWGYLGEETGQVRAAGSDPHVWLVDPNDGTQAMQQGDRGHAVSIALLRDGLPVLGVVHSVDAPDDEGDRFAWAEGCGPLTRNGQPVRRAPWSEQLGTHDLAVISPGAERHPAGNLACLAPARFVGVASIAYRLALVAAGEGEVAVGLSRPGAWDYGGGHALLRAVGGTLYDESGSEVIYTREGHSSTWCCFGGGPALARELSSRMSCWARAARSGYGQVAPPSGFEPTRLRVAELVHESGALRRAQGCLIGQVAGDSLGALVEFQSAEQISARFPGEGLDELADGGPHGIAAGQPTDDSELALILARTLVRWGGYDLEAVAAGYARWYRGWTHRQPCDHDWCQPFDVGGTTSQALGAVSLEQIRAGGAARAAIAAASPTSQANGALMRISPLGIWGWQRTPGEVAEAARDDARLTHPHAVCQEASALFAVTIAQAIREGGEPRQVYEWSLGWARSNVETATVIESLERAATEPPADFQSQQGWVLIALQNAFYRLLTAPSLRDGVVATIRAGGDSDTNGAICAALLGAVHGREAIPGQWRRMVLSCRPMPGYSHFRRPRPAIYWPADALALAERLLLGSAS